MKGIDVSKWNGIIDWAKVKADGVSFAILKVISKSGNVEESFERNYAGATSVGIPVSVYNYSYALSIEDAIKDAECVIKACKGKKIERVWLDVEDKSQTTLKSILADIIIVYKTTIESAGLKFGIYTGLSFYKSYLKPYSLPKNMPYWIARYPSSKTMKMSDEPNKDKYPDVQDIYMWQYTSSGSVNGINGRVDLNVAYTNTEYECARYSKSAQGNVNISKNFKVKEFACKDGFDGVLVDERFVREKLQKIRDHFGKPVVINSAYRTISYNRRVGGATASYHIKGRAFDIAIKGVSLDEICKYAESIGIMGIIRYNTFVHLDSREKKYYATNNNGVVKSVQHW